MNSTRSAESIHRDALIIDGLIWYSDGGTTELRQGNVAAIKLTVQATDVEGDSATCLDDMAR